MLQNQTAEQQYFPPIFGRKDELKAKFGSQLENRKAFLSDHEITPQEQLQRDEILSKNPNKVKVFCLAGVNRSGYVRQLLEQRGYNVDNAGVGGAKPFGKDDLLKEYDAFIFVSPVEHELFNQRIKELGLEDRVAGVLTRDLNFHENSAFYLDDAEKNKKLAEIGPKLEADLDRLGFVNKVELNK